MKSPNFKTWEEAVNDFTEYKGTMYLSPETTETLNAYDEVTKLKINNKTYYLIRNRRVKEKYALYLWNPPF